MKTKRIYSIFADKTTGYIYSENEHYYFMYTNGVSEFIADLDNFLLSLIYRGYSIKTFEPNNRNYIAKK